MLDKINELLKKIDDTKAMVEELKDYVKQGMQPALPGVQVPAIPSTKVKVRNDEDEEVKRIPNKPIMPPPSVPTPMIPLVSDAPGTMDEVLELNRLLMIENERIQNINLIKNLVEKYNNGRASIQTLPKSKYEIVLTEAKKL